MGLLCVCSASNAQRVLAMVPALPGCLACAWWGTQVLCRNELSLPNCTQRERVFVCCGACPLLTAWLQVVKMCLFNTYSSKSVRLDEFEQVQIAATDAVANHLRDNWAASIKNIIK